MTPIGTGIDAPETAEKRKPVTSPSLDELSTDLSVVPSGRAAVEKLVSESLHSLSSNASFISGLPSFVRLKTVLNSTIGNTKPFCHVDVSRWEHSVHTAAEAHNLPDKVTRHLTKHEQEVLELAALLHDYGHVSGSHAMDRVFYALKDSPRIKEYGYTEVEYHEYHGALLLGKGVDSNAIRSKLGEALFQDVMAVLTFDDKRSKEAKQAEYGTTEPTLSESRIHLLYKVKDTLDRIAYLKTDYLSSGYRTEIIDQAVATVDSYRNSLQISSDASELVVPQDEAQKVVDFYDLRTRQFRNISPGHPIAGLQTEFLQRSASSRLLQSEKPSSSSQSYEHMRKALLANDCAAVLGQEAASVFLSGNKCVSEIVAPLVTLNRDDFSGIGQSALQLLSEDDVPQMLRESFNISSVQNVTLLELILRHQFEKYDVDLYCVISPANADKKIPYRIANDDEKTSEENTYNKKFTTGPAGYVIIAAVATGANGENIDLSDVRNQVYKWLEKTGYIKSGVDIRDLYNPRVFLDLADPTLFLPEVQAAISRHVPEWMKNGGCGLLGD